MKKTILLVGLLVAAMMMLGVGVAFAQGPALYAGNGPALQNGAGWMHDYMEKAFAAKLGLTENLVEDQLASGKRMYQIALDNGIQQEALTDFMNGVHADALATAVKDGVVSQEQADWMLQRMQNRGGYGVGNCPMQNGQTNPGGGYGRGMMNGNGRGMMRGGFGWQNQQTNP
jgi:hypothetical protein